MDHPVVLFLLRAIHIIGGVFWVGGIVMVTLFVLPAARSVGPSGQQMLMDIMLRRKLSVYLIASAILTTIAGFLLYGRNMSLSAGAWGRSPMGIGMTVGAVCAIIAVIIGMTISAPAAKKMAAAGAPGGTPLTEEERNRLQRLTGVASRVVLVLLAVAVMTMATARYY
jgi:uncharacterized membrane protein